MYDVQSIQQKQMEMEQTLTDAINQVNETKGSTHQNISTEGEDFYLMIPIMDEEQLFIFEEKLLEKSYKLCVVSENITFDLTILQFIVSLIYMNYSLINSYNL